MIVVLQTPSDGPPAARPAPGNYIKFSPQTDYFAKKYNKTILRLDSFDFKTLIFLFSANRLLPMKQSMNLTRYDLQNRK